MFLLILLDVNLSVVLSDPYTLLPCTKMLLLSWCFKEMNAHLHYLDCMSFTLSAYIHESLTAILLGGCLQIYDKLPSYSMRPS